MRTFGGRQQHRNAEFARAFNDIQAVGGQDFIVAGFTEIMNGTRGLREALSGLAQALDAGLRELLVLEVGTTALRTREFIGIAWDPAYVTMDHAGQVVWDARAKRWAAYNRSAGAMINRTIHLPAGEELGADTRGLACIAARYNGGHFLFGFMHNMYRLGNRFAAYTSLPDMADLARRATRDPAYHNAEVIIGGDFNLRPRDPRRPRGNALVLSERAAMNRRGYVNTTLVNPYDYFVVSNQNIGRQNAEVHRRTRVAHCSDHAAIAFVG